MTTIVHIDPSLESHTHSAPSSELQSQSLKTTQSKICQLLPNLKIGAFLGGVAVVTFVAAVLASGISAPLSLMIAASIVMFIGLTVLLGMIKNKEENVETVKELTPTHQIVSNMSFDQALEKATQIVEKVCAAGVIAQESNRFLSEITGIGCSEERPRPFSKEGESVLDSANVLETLGSDFDRNYQVVFEGQTYKQLETLKTALEKRLPGKNEQQILEILCGCGQRAITESTWNRFAERFYEDIMGYVCSFNEQANEIKLSINENNDVMFNYSVTFTVDLRDYTTGIARSIENSYVAHFTHSTGSSNSEFRIERSS